MRIKNFSYLIFLSFCMAGFILASTANAQPSSLTKEEMLQYTPLWEGERFPDGRPKVPDEIIERMQYVSITEAWGILRRIKDGSTDKSGEKTTYANQYYGGFKQMYDDITICGRASTIHFMPFRPDVNSAIQAQGDKDGRSRQYTWGVDQLKDGDVYVANVCEAVLDASHVGDNLGTTIFTKSGNGAIIRGTVRDIEGNKNLEGFNLLVRDFRPESNRSNMVIGLNAPIQIGYITVMPGDIVLAKQMGLAIIPPHLAGAVVERSEKTRLKDVFAHAGVREGRFTANQADGAFTDAMNKEYTEWLEDNADTMGKFFKDPAEAPSPEFIRAYAKERESGEDN